VTLNFLRGPLEVPALDGLEQRHSIAGASILAWPGWALPADPGAATVQIVEGESIGAGAADRATVGLPIQ
jgi:hypothetical protein